VEVIVWLGFRVFVFTVEKKNGMIGVWGLVLEVEV